MIDVEKILRKRKPKGEDLARLEIARLMNEYAQTNLGAVNGQLEELPDNIQHYFDQPHHIEKITPDALETIKIRYQQNATNEDRRVYAAYKTMYAWVNQAQGRAQMHTQRATTAYNYLYQSALDSVVAENIYRYEASLPIIMTETQYSEYRKKRGEDIEPTPNGLAIIKDGSIIGGEGNPRIDGKGYYCYPNSCKEIADMVGLEKYIDRDSSRQVALIYQGNLKESLKFARGINAIIETAAKVFDVEELLIALADVTIAEAHFAAYNSIRDSLALILENSQHYQPVELKNKKLETLAQLLPPLSFDDFQIKEQQREEGEKLMRDYIKHGTSLFNYNDNTLINLFCV